MSNEFEVISIDIPNIIFEESKKYRLVYSVKNEFNLQPGTIVYFPFLDTVGVFEYTGKHESVFHYLEHDGSIGLLFIKASNMYKDVKITTRQSEQPFNSLEKYALNEIVNVFEKNINLFKCPCCKKYSLKILKQNSVFLYDCNNCGAEDSLSNLMKETEYYIKNAEEN